METSNDTLVVKSKSHSSASKERDQVKTHQPDVPSAEEMINSQEKIEIIKNEILEYSDSIEMLASTKSPLEFYNSGATHAAIVMSNIYKYSENTINIFAGSFSGEVSGQSIYLKALKSYLERGGKLSIVLEKINRNQKNKDIFDILTKYKLCNPGQIEIGITENVVVNDKGEKIHLTIGGKSIYRLEEDTKNFIAKGSFYAPEQVKHLLKIFNEIKEHSFIDIDLN